MKRTSISTRRLIPASRSQRTVVSHGVQGWARTATVALLRCNVGWPLASRPRMTVRDDMPDRPVWRDEIDYEEHQVDQEDYGADQLALKG